MRQIIKTMCYLVAALSLVACNRGIPIVGLDEKGESRFFQIYEEKFSEETASLLQEVSRAVNKGAVPIEKNERSWSIHTVAVGIGAAAQIDTAPAPLFLSVEPRVRFIFTDKEKPITP